MTHHLTGRRVCVIALFMISLSVLPGANFARQNTGDGGGADEVDPQWSPDGSQMVFSVVTGEDEAIYVVDVNTMQFDNLITQPDDGRQARWSPNGDRIAFIKSGDLAIVNNDGSDLVSMTDDALTRARNPLWSPDGQYILVEADSVSGRDLYLINAEGGSPRNVSEDDALRYFPTWSPDSTRIAYRASRQDEEINDIFIFDHETGKTTSVLDESRNDDQRCCFVQWDWSPDSDAIAFAFGRSVLSNLYTFDIATEVIEPQLYLGGVVRHIEWLPNGDDIIMSMVDGLQLQGEENIGLFNVNLEAGTIDLIGERDIRIVNTAVSPNGRYAAILEIGDPHVISVFDLEQSLSKPVLLQQVHNAFGMQWSPNNEALAVSVCPDITNDSDLYLFDVVDRTITDLTSDGPFAINEDFSERCIAFG